MNVFVYGTLTDPERAARVLEEFVYRGDATLAGLHRIMGAYPTLAPGGSTQGRLLQTDEIAALDRYEGVDRGLYTRVSVHYLDDSQSAVDEGDTDGTVAVYVGNPAELGVTESISWPGSGPFAARVERYVHENSVHVRVR